MTTATSRRLHSTPTDTLPAPRHPEPNPRADDRLPAPAQRASAVVAFPVRRWRAVLEDRWKYRVIQVTELSLAFHTAAEHPADRAGQRAAPELRRLQRQTAAARRALADIDDALARLSTGRYGYCEQCGADIAVARLANTPEARYCQRCFPDSP